MIPALQTYWRSLASGEAKSLPDRLPLALLTPPALIYSLVQRLRATLYRTGILATRRLPRPVISVGNLTVGGTGKTPVTAHIAKTLISQGYRVAVLSRGYGGSLEGHPVVVSDGATVMLRPEQCGDEPYLLASTIPGLMVVTGSDRFTAGMLAMERLAPDVFLLDDGFQHLRLHRDLNILLLDHARPFGNGLTLPAGLLREPVSAASRAGLVILTRCPAGASLPAACPALPFCATDHRLTDLIPLSGGEPLGFETLRNQRVLAFAGIADPRAFFNGLRQRGVNVAAECSLPDHAIYDGNTTAALVDSFHACGADYAITTEKDGVKLARAPRELKNRILMARLSLTFQDPAPLTSALRNLLQN